MHTYIHAITYILCVLERDSVTTYPSPLFVTYISISFSVFIHVRSSPFLRLVLVWEEDWMAMVIALEGSWEMNLKWLIGVSDTWPTKTAP